MADEYTPSGIEYDVRCTGCGHEFSCQHKLAEDHPPCEKCGEVVETVLAPTSGSIAGPRGPIVDMRQVHSSHGRRWRQTPNSDTPGGAGKKAFGSPGVRPGAGASADKLPKGSWGGDVG